MIWFASVSCLMVVGVMCVGLLFKFVLCEFACLIMVVNLCLCLWLVCLTLYVLF